jgi:hypothetical protein
MLLADTGCSKLNFLARSGATGLADALEDSGPQNRIWPDLSVLARSTL